MKNYTDLEQSERLRKVLPPQSADGWYQRKSESEYNSTPNLEGMIFEDDIPCWSLTALLIAMPNIIGGCIKTLRLFNNAWHCSFIEIGTSKCLFDEFADNPIDACVEMIEKLHKQKLL